MRPLRIDITGATDANGNASIRVPLPQTGEWHDVKFALSLPSVAEWAILVSGRPATFGRGRRVTLGPELIQDGETVTVTVTGGPASSAIDGTAMGKSGDPLAIMASYTPAPNTIALDSLNTQRQLDVFTQAPNTVVNGRIYSMPLGTQSIRFQINQNQQVVTFTNFKVIGQGTGIVYIFPSAASGVAGGFDEWFKPAPPDVLAGIAFSLDTTGSANGVEVVITADLGMNHVIASLFGNGTSAGSPIITSSPNPALWQAATKSFAVSSAVAVGATVNCIPAVVGQVVRIFSLSAQTDNGGGQVGQFQDTTGADAVAIGRSTSATAPDIGQIIIPIPMAARPLASGVGLDFKNVAGALATFLLTGAYSQG